MTALHDISIIQGGMGIAVSGWRLARAVAQMGQMGVVSGTCINVVIARRLQDGDAGGHVRRALRAFPDQAMAERVLEKYFRADGRNGEPYKTVPMFTIAPSQNLLELSVIANFVEVWLAKEGHDGLVGINYLTKVDLPLPSSAMGAMLAGVDYVLMGAGIPSQVPGVLTSLSKIEPFEMRAETEEGTDPVSVHFDPTPFAFGRRSLKRPHFLAIVGSVTLAQFLARDPVTRPDGFVIEGPTAGGHNAPPRGKMQLDDSGQPIYGARDTVDLVKFANIGLPFWLAGGYGTPEGVQDAKAQGAQGVQVGTAFAFCEDSELEPGLRAEILQDVKDGKASVYTDPLASPSGYPFKVVNASGTLAFDSEYEQRSRICDLGFLRSTFRRDDGKGAVAYRCPAEPVDQYVKKGGDPQATENRKCLCNALFADVGLPQVRKDNVVELPLVTAGDDLVSMTRLLAPGKSSYSAADVVNYLLSKEIHGSD